MRGVMHGLRWPLALLGAMLWLGILLGVHFGDTSTAAIIGLGATIVMLTARKLYRKRITTFYAIASIALGMPLFVLVSFGNLLTAILLASVAATTLTLCLAIPLRNTLLKIHKGNS